MTHKVCSKRSDAYVMEQILVTGRQDFYCIEKSSISLGALAERLHKQQCGVLRVNTFDYRITSRGCLTCHFYKGNYPTGKEVIGK